MSISYRPEIDGLRAVSVLAVVLYHAEFFYRGDLILGGGFIGVDVFFVVSGYLICHVILQDLKRGDFSFLRFYEKRARRILPILFTVMIASLPFAWQLMMPKMMREYAGSVLSSLVFGSNFWFWREDSYWAEPSALKPFLHTWSLSVEEQFYLLFPIFLLLLWRWKRDWILPVFASLLLMTLLMSEHGSRNFPQATFYLLPTRGWELLAGAILAHLEVSKGRHNTSVLGATMPGIGLLLIIGSFVWFDNQTRHPSFMTTIPVLGSMLVIWFANKNDLTTKMLSCRPIVGLGLISYGLYLWHYPIFAFSAIKGGLDSEYAKVGIIALALTLSIVTYFLLERPARNRQLLGSKAFMGMVGTSFAALATIFSLLFWTDGAKYRTEVDQLFLGRGYWEKGLGNRERFWTYHGCWLSTELLDSDDPFSLCKDRENPGSKKPIMVIGDSHVAGLIPGLVNIFGREAIAQGWSMAAGLTLTI